MKVVLRSMRELVLRFFAVAPVYAQLSTIHSRLGRPQAASSAAVWRAGSPKPVGRPK
jgi:hypothetical protein